MSTPSKTICGGRFGHPLQEQHKVTANSKAAQSGKGGRFFHPLDEHNVKIQLPATKPTEASLATRVVEAEEVTFLSDILEVFKKIFDWIFGREDKVPKVAEKTSVEKAQLAEPKEAVLQSEKECRRDELLFLRETAVQFIKNHYSVYESCEKGLDLNLYYELEGHPFKYFPNEAATLMACILHSGVGKLEELEKIQKDVIPLIRKCDVELKKLFPEDANIVEEHEKMKRNEKIISIKIETLKACEKTGVVVERPVKPMTLAEIKEVMSRISSQS